jgi:hypothetical protein
MIEIPRRRQEYSEFMSAIPQTERLTCGKRIFFCDFLFIQRFLRFGFVLHAVLFLQCINYSTSRFSVIY